MLELDGIKLFQVMSKIMELVIIERIQKGVDQFLKKEQTRLHKNKYNRANIHLHKHLKASPALERNYVCSILLTLKKAFDSAHCEGLENKKIIRHC